MEMAEWKKKELLVAAELFINARVCKVRVGSPDVAVNHRHSSSISTCCAPSFRLLCFYLHYDLNTSYEDQACSRSALPIHTTLVLYTSSASYCVQSKALSCAHATPPHPTMPPADSPLEWRRRLARPQPGPFLPLRLRETSRHRLPLDRLTQHPHPTSNTTTDRPPNHDSR